MTVRAPVLLAALVALVLLAAACGGDGSTETAADDAGSTSSTSSTDGSGSTTTDEAIGASTTSTLTATTAATTAGTASASTTERSSTTEAATTTIETTTTESSDPTPSTTVIDGGSLFEFSSPSGNIACVMSERFTSCWISEKAWTIDQPDDPDCELSDWGNAVDLTADGPAFPCYTDMVWNLFAPALAYDAAVDVGPFRCLSARSGVTCTNASGNGFTLARASVRLF